MAAHSSMIAWEIPWTEEPGRPQSVGSQSRTRLTRLSTHPGLSKWAQQGAPQECVRGLLVHIIPFRPFLFSLSTKRLSIFFHVYSHLFSIHYWIQPVQLFNYFYRMYEYGCVWCVCIFILILHGSYMLQVYTPSLWLAFSLLTQYISVNRHSYF